jgi:hypothetical protein
MKEHNTVRHLFGLFITMLFVLGFIRLEGVIINCIYFVLFMLTCREILHYHTLQISQKSQTVDLMKLIQYWTSLYSYQLSYYLLNNISTYFNSTILTVLINGTFLSIMIYAFQDIANDFETCPLINLTYVKRVDLGNNNNTIVKLVNSSVNFYRVNMKVYDHMFLSVLPKFFYNIFMIVYESYGFSTNFILSSYHKSKTLAETLRDRYIGSGNPEHQPEHVLAQSQTFDSLNQTNNQNIVINTLDQDLNQEQKQEHIDNSDDQEHEESHKKDQ